MRSTLMIPDARMVTAMVPIICTNAALYAREQILLRPGPDTSYVKTATYTIQRISRAALNALPWDQRRLFPGTSNAKTAIFTIPISAWNAQNAACGDGPHLSSAISNAKTVTISIRQTIRAVPNVNQSSRYRMTSLLILHHCLEQLINMSPDRRVSGGFGSPDSADEHISNRLCSVAEFPSAED